MRNRNRFAVLTVIAGLTLIAVISTLAVLYFYSDGFFETQARPLTTVETIAGLKNELGEPFGIAIKGSEVYVSDGLNNKIWRISYGNEPIEFASGLSTPSAIAFSKEGDLIVADTGSHTIKKIDRAGKITILAGSEHQLGDGDGAALTAKFNAPIGVAVLDDGAVAVADTYNDKIKLIRNGSVTTIAGSTRGFADGTAANAKFDSPCGVAGWTDGSILVADTMNSRIRMINSNGIVSTVAGSGNAEVHDGSLLAASFYRPFAITAAPDGTLLIGDNNAVRMIKNSPLPMVETISDTPRGFIDGPSLRARFNRVSGLGVTDQYELFVADSDNGAVRRFSGSTYGKDSVPEIHDRTRRTDPAEFRTRQPARWPFDPPGASRDIAGTLGEIRDVYVDQNSRPRFHNGLDIAGNYGETARFLRDEKALNPFSAENFETLRELIRLPTIGYIHIRLGRDASKRPLGDDRFQFDPGLTDVRVRRGTEFKAGDVIGTLNAMNHVHMIAGPTGDEMNALDALILPGVKDTIAPTIEEAGLYDQNWTRIETESPGARNNLPSNARIVVRAFDRMDGNPERRRLGVFRLGYLLMKSDHWSRDEVNWTISFDRNPSPDAVKFAYGPGSKSGPTGETVFRYVVTNRVSGDAYSEGFFDPNGLDAGKYVIRVFAADYFGNTTSKDINFEVAK